jgi:hypothetical protein
VKVKANLLHAIDAARTNGMSQRRLLKWLKRKESSGEQMSEEIDSSAQEDVDEAMECTI